MRYRLDQENELEKYISTTSPSIEDLERVLKNIFTRLIKAHTPGQDSSKGYFKSMSQNATNAEEIQKSLHEAKNQRSLKKILSHLILPTKSPPLYPARGPPTGQNERDNYTQLFPRDEPQEL